MKVVVIVTNSLSGGGAERAMNLLSNNLSKSPELKVILIPINAGPPDLVEPKCDISEINRVWNGGLWDTFKAFVRFQGLIIKLRPNFLILNCDLPEFFSALSFWKAKCIIVEHTTRPWCGRSSLGNLVRFVLRTRGASYVRVSERIDEPSCFKNRTLIPNMVDSAFLAAGTNQSETSNSQGKLLFVGRLSKEKRPELFIQLSRATGIESVVIGDGLLGSQLRRASEEVLNLKFLGQQLNPWQHASKRDLLVLTSDYEGDGLVALEAISIGIPVALRNTSDLQKIGFPFRNYYEDIQALSERIKHNHFDDFELSVFERDQILKNRSPEEVTQLWLEFMMSI